MNKPVARNTKWKMSNLLLIGVVLTSVVFLSSFIVSVNTKVKNGDITYVNRDKSMYSRHHVDEGKIIVVENIADCMVVLSDSMALEIHKDDADNVSYVDLSDSITISQSSPLKNRIFIYLPSGSHLVARSSGVTIKGSLFDHESKASYDVVLRDSKLFVSAAKLHTFLDRLRVSGYGQAALTIDDFVHIANLEIANVNDVSIAQAWGIGNFKTAFMSGSEMNKAGDRVSIKSE